MDTITPDRCAELIDSSQRVVALTGAGLSTAAGIPDFRGPQGLYVTRRYDPEKVFEIGWFRREPVHFYEFARDFVALARQVVPTYAHRFLGDLEKSGRLAGVVTQNIDMLHQLAGNRNLVELHGSCRSAHCTSCGQRLTKLDYAWWEAKISGSSRPPLALCEKCGGVLKPGIVFFGELVDRFSAAEDLVAGCDLLLVLGSSLNVTPASLLPYATGAPTVVINQGGSALPPSANRFFVSEDLDSYFQAVQDCLDRRQSSSSRG